MMHWKGRWFDDWSEGYDFAQKQAITGMVFREIESMAPNIPDMPEMLMYQWIGIAEQIKQQNHVVNQEVEKLARLLDDNGIKYAVVKGQVVARYYSKNENVLREAPEHLLERKNPNLNLGEYRQSGDIDFYVPQEDVERAQKLICREWGVEMERDDSPYHYHFEHGGVTYEMHFRLFQWYQEKREKRWQEILHGAMGHRVLIGDTQVATLIPSVHTLYIFMHLYHHLVELGVGLRQFCDLWMMLLSKEVNMQELKGYLEELGMTRAFRACEYILSEKLELPKEYLPYKIGGIDRWFGGRLLDVVLYRGNMGHFNKRGGWKGLKHQIESACIKIAHFTKFVLLSPGYQLGWMAHRVKGSF